MIYLNAGNIWDNDYLDTVIRWNEEFKDSVQVKALFGSIAKLTPTARSADRLPYRDLAFCDKYIDNCQKAGIAIRYTLNASCLGSMQDFKETWPKLRDDLCDIHHLGVDEWTITSPLLVELVRELFPTDFIEVSTIAEVSTPGEMDRWANLGADGANISTSINRNLKVIKETAKVGQVTILANEACLYRCPWRRECYNLSSHDSQRSEELFGFYPFRRCTEVRLAHPEEWIRSRMVLPQWMQFYQKATGVNWFKVAFRTHPKEVALPILRFYMEQKLNGNLLELWPTIAHLGSTAEPKDTTFIPTEVMDDVFKDLILPELDCENQVCGITCHVCEKVYRLSQKK